MACDLPLERPDVAMRNLERGLATHHGHNPARCRQAALGQKVWRLTGIQTPCTTYCSYLSHPLLVSDVLTEMGSFGEAEVLKGALETRLQVLGLAP